MSGQDKTHPIGDRWGRVKNFDFCSEEEPSTTWPYMLWIEPGARRMHVRDIDDTAWFEVGIANGVTKTVKATGGDFTTIQAAIDSFKGMKVIDCKIEVEAGTYNEGLTFEDIFITSEGSLELEGDTRVLAGLSYVDGARPNRKSLANGGRFTAGTPCALSTNPGLDQITVSGYEDPDFDAAGWVNGDIILVYANDGDVYERTVNSISPGGAGNNVIEITVALPSALGDDGTALLLVPNRRITGSVGNYGISVDGIRGVLIDGFGIASGASGILADNGAVVELQNVSIYSQSTYGLNAINLSKVVAADGANSAWSGASNYYADHQSVVNASYSVAVGGTVGFSAYRYSEITATIAIAVNSTYGYLSQYLGLSFVTSCTARQCFIGYYASTRGYIYAQNTDAQNYGNTQDYSPAVSNDWGNNNGSITWS